jgi:hypothetical protein
MGGLCPIQWMSTILEYNSMTKSVPDFTQIHPAVELNHVDRWTDQPYTLSFHALCANNTQKWEYNGTEYKLFTDFKKVYDSVCRNVL